jgi:hypothetical protein
MGMSEYTPQPSADVIEDTAHLNDRELAIAYYRGEQPGKAVMARLLQKLGAGPETQRTYLEVPLRRQSGETLVDDSGNAVTFGQYLDGPAQIHKATDLLVGFVAGNPSEQAYAGMQAMVEGYTGMKLDQPAS